MFNPFHYSLSTLNRHTSKPLSTPRSPQIAIAPLPLDRLSLDRLSLDRLSLHHHFTPFLTVPLSLSLLTPHPAQADPVILSFALEKPSRPPSHVHVSPIIPPNFQPLPTSQPISQPISQPSLDQLFVGQHDSLVARTIGAAEGTLTPTGDRTWAYEGHSDPGNGAWNQGIFSYQHPARSPEEADQLQLARLQTQAQALQHQAQALGLQLSLDELLNGLDLANQAPLAALSPAGYIDWLAQLRSYSWPLARRIIEARTWSYWDPQLQSWNAPGLGNTYDSIRADQERRYEAIQAAIAAIRDAAPAALPSPPKVAVE